MPHESSVDGYRLVDLSSRSITRNSLYVLLRGAAAELALQHGAIRHRGLTVSEYVVLQLVHELEKGRASVPQLARILHLDPKSIAQTVSQLIVKELLIRQKVRGRRARTLVLSKSGSELRYLAAYTFTSNEQKSRRAMTGRNASLLVSLLLEFLGEH